MPFADLTSHLSQIADPIVLPNLLHSHLMNIKATNMLWATGFVQSISIRPASRALCLLNQLGSGVCMLSFTREQNVSLVFFIYLFFFLYSCSPAARSSNFLLCSHFPIITEAYKLPWGTILDLLMFPAFSRCLASKSLSQPLRHLCLCGTI